MTKRVKNPNVDDYFNNTKNRRAEQEKLRGICLGCGLEEELKWSMPCYIFEGKNVVMIQGFKSYCALLFFKGALLKDSRGILVKMGANTHVGRQIRFGDAQDIAAVENVLRDYINEAVEVEKRGEKVPEKKSTAIKIPVEFKNKMDGSAALKKAFYELTPGRQRAYIYYFSGAKRAETRVARVEKCSGRILNGKGLDD